jgi:hypothetical protein
MSREADQTLCPGPRRIAEPLLVVGEPLDANRLAGRRHVRQLQPAIERNVMERAARARPVHAGLPRHAGTGSQVQRQLRPAMRGALRTRVGRLAQPDARKRHVGLRGHGVDHGLQHRRQRSLLGDRHDDRRQRVQFHARILSRKIIIAD